VSRSPMLCTAGLLVVLLGGCTSSLSADAVATEAENALEDQFGFRPDIVCPEDVPQEEGATARCVLTAGDDPTEYGVTITVTGVDDGATFDVEVDDEPLE
jgi:Domain of unknown function (DUF4333)